MPRKTGLVYHDCYLDHNTGYDHVEYPDRLKVCIESLKTAEIWNELIMIDPTPAKFEWIALAHEPQHIDQIIDFCDRGISLDYDTPVCEVSFGVASMATGGVMRAADLVISGEIDNAFALVRPPGHHATPDRSMGFCLINHVAITARYLQRYHGLKRIAIVDWDVHHGNGTQDIFYDDGEIFFFSVHQSPLYPGSGLKNEIGIDQGLGTTLNAPLPSRSGIADYVGVFENELKPALIDFQPEFLLISAGFDAHKRDPLSEMNLTSDDFGTLTDLVKSIADDLCDGRIVSSLEGGYDLDGLSSSVVKHIQQLRSD